MTFLGQGLTQFGGNYTTSPKGWVADDAYFYLLHVVEFFMDA
jgi:hypothetical protein